MHCDVTKIRDSCSLLHTCRNLLELAKRTLLVVTSFIKYSFVQLKRIEMDEFGNRIMPQKTLTSYKKTN